MPFKGHSSPTNCSGSGSGASPPRDYFPPPSLRAMITPNAPPMMSSLSSHKTTNQIDDNDYDVSAAREQRTPHTQFAGVIVVVYRQYHKVCVGECALSFGWFWDSGKVPHVVTRLLKERLGLLRVWRSLFIFNLSRNPANLCTHDLG